jgi:predicted ATPase
MNFDGFLKSIALKRDQIPSFDRYPFSIPAVRHLKALKLDPKVTFFVGENGSGKSTLIEAIAVAAGFNAEGGSKDFNFATQSTESELHKFIQLVRGYRREKDGFFLRAESLYNVATQIENLGVSGSYGGKSLHEQSHGESFIALAGHRFRGDGLYILDEPEAALSPSRQLVLMNIINTLVERKNSQFIIATHSPILLAYPEATIFSLDSSGISKIAYQDTEHFQITRDFLLNREVFLHHLFNEN